MRAPTVHAGWRTGGLLAVVLLAVSGTALGQTPSPRGFVTLTGAYQFTPDLLQRGVYDSNQERGGFEARQDKNAFVLEPMAGLRVWRQLAVAVTVSRLTLDRPATITAQLPHPFFFDQHREVTGSVEALARRELAVHSHLLWAAPAGPLDVSIFGGPTLFRVTQTLVTDVLVRDVYPFDVANFRSASTGESSTVQIGFNVGADVSYFFSNTFGLGWLVRFSRGTADFSSVVGAPAESDLGGLRTGAGVRVRF